MFSSDLVKFIHDVCIVFTAANLCELRLHVQSLLRVEVRRDNLKGLVVLREGGIYVANFRGVDGAKDRQDARNDKNNVEGYGTHQGRDLVPNRVTRNPSGMEPRTS